MSTAPQPLTGTEIKRGIAVRMTEGLPQDVHESLRKQIITGLEKTCSLLTHTVYAKFKAKWMMVWWRDGDDVHAGWWVEYNLDDFGRVTTGSISSYPKNIPNSTAKCHDGTIDEVPPDRFRRETDQPIPKPTALKQPEPEKSTFSKAMRGARKRSEV